MPCLICRQQTWAIDGLCDGCGRRPATPDLPAITDTEVRRLIDHLDSCDEVGLFRGLADCWPSVGLLRAVLLAVDWDRSRTGSRAVKLRGLLEAAVEAAEAVRFFELGDVHVWCCEDDCACVSAVPAGSPDVPAPCEACDERVHGQEQTAVGTVLAYLRGML